jgi:hypothetical protein
VSGFCSNGSCNGWIMSSYITTSGSCDGGVSYQASGYTQSSMISGTCMAGNFSAYPGPQYVNFSGGCSNGSSFSATGMSGGPFISGSCSTNGSFFGNIYPTDMNVSGSCR